MFLGRMTHGTVLYGYYASCVNVGSICMGRCGRLQLIGAAPEQRAACRLVSWLCAQYLLLPCVLGP